MTTIPPEDLAFYTRVQNVAVKAARAAAEIITAAAGSVSTDEIRSKGTHDLVTVVDEEAERTIISIIRHAFPDHAILAEESSDGSFGEASHAVALWIIDPIDGTTNFMHGVPPYAVSIAFRHRGRMSVGVVLDVAHDDLFTAIDGQGLFFNGSPASVAKTDSLSESLITTGFPYRSYGHIDVYLAVLRRFMEAARGVRRPGSASVDLAWVAVGRFDGFFETGLMPWDVAAGIVLVREGGGTISDYTGNPDPEFSAQIVASNGAVHEEILAILEPMKQITD